MSDENRRPAAADFILSPNENATLPPEPPLIKEGDVLVIRTATGEHVGTATVGKAIPTKGAPWEQSFRVSRYEKGEGHGD